MAEEQSSGIGLRFRLPRLSGDAAKNTDTENVKSDDAEAQPEKATPSKTAGKAAPGKAPAAADPSTPQGKTSPMMASQTPPGTGPITPTILSQQIATQTGLISDELVRLRTEIELMQHAFVELGERESNQEKVFDLLHKELSDYKNDFIYEHLKPVIRPLLFLYDSLEQFDDELQPFVRDTDERRQMLSPKLVGENMKYFQDQLVEALQVCEVTMMQKPQGQFDPKLHKAVDVVAVTPDKDNTIQRVVRTGWYLRGQLFRPAEVVVGRRSA